jgi:malate dehydrogenase (oxaloacetate-decarboxylating)
VIPPEEVGEEYLIPSVFNRAVVPAIAHAVAQAALAEGVARREHLPAGGD